MTLRLKRLVVFGINKVALIYMLREKFFLLLVLILSLGIIWLVQMNIQLTGEMIPHGKVRKHSPPTRIPYKRKEINRHMDKFVRKRRVEPPNNAVKPTQSSGLDKITSTPKPVFVKKKKSRLHGTDRFEKDLPTIFSALENQSSERPILTFPTAALKDLFQQHDRFLVKSMLFFNSLTEQDINSWKPTPKQQQAEKDVCIIALAVNRKIPYIELLVYMLTQGQRTDEIFNKVDVHVMNVEQRVGLQSIEYLHNIKKLGFIKLHDFSKSIEPNQDYGLSQRRSHKAALEICRSKNSKWCVIMEDDAFLPVGFIKLFEEFIVERLNGRENEYALIKLFDPFNNALQHENDLKDTNWVNNWYETYKAKMGSSNSFKIVPTSTTYGGWANAFPQSSVADLIKLYGSYKELNINMMNDVFVNEVFPKVVKKRKAKCEPSMVSHIGLYSEQDRKDDFSRVFADVRFQVNSDPV